MNIEDIWFEYQNSLKAFLHANVSNPSDVDDLLQEILIKTFQHLPQVSEAKKIKSWLFQIANRTIIDFYRKRAATNSRLDTHDNWYEQRACDLFEQLADCVIPFIKGLPKSEAQLLNAIEIDGISQKEYADAHGIKYSTLKSRVKKSRNNLFKLFNECCELSLDSKGRLIDYSAKKTSCIKC